MNLGLYSAVQGLQAAQLALDTASHNISNVNTPGYSRQRTEQSARAPQQFAASSLGTIGNVGTGVEITAINRMRDQFIHRQIHAESATLGESQVQSDTLRQVEDILAEPSDRALSTVMTRFWDGWQDLSTHPENKALRVNIREVAVEMTAVFNDTRTKLIALRQDVNDRIDSVVGNINSLSDQIARLNRQIGDAFASGANPNDLQDQQDVLIEELSELVPVRMVEVPSNGHKNVYVAGQPLVAGINSFHFDANPVLTAGFFDVLYEITGTTAEITGGKLGALLDARNLTLDDGLTVPPLNPPGLIAQLDALAKSIIDNVNALHTTGFGLDGTTGLNFFNGTDASTMIVNPNITDLATGADLIAAASNDPGSLTGGPGDNGNAIAIGRLRLTKLMTGNQDTFDDFYKGLVTEVGVKSQEARRREMTQESLVASVKSRKEETSGVSIDEEMADVIKYQKAYAASARVLTTIDQMLEVLLNIGR